MASKSANVIARVEPDVKEKAEAILSSIGLSASSSINMFYRQVIVCNGLPFRPVAQMKRPEVLSEMTEEAFNKKMLRGLDQAKSGEGDSSEDFFESLRQEIVNEYV